MNNYLLIYIL